MLRYAWRIWWQSSRGVYGNMTDWNVRLRFCFGFADNWNGRLVQWVFAGWILPEMWHRSCVQSNGFSICKQEEIFSIYPDQLVVLMLDDFIIIQPIQNHHHQSNKQSKCVFTLLFIGKGRLFINSLFLKLKSTANIKIETKNCQRNVWPWTARDAASATSFPENWINFSNSWRTSNRYTGVRVERSFDRKIWRRFEANLWFGRSRRWDSVTKIRFDGAFGKVFGHEQNYQHQTVSHCKSVSTRLAFYSTGSSSGVLSMRE